jgi:hypothetical protein
MSDEPPEVPEPPDPDGVNDPPEAPDTASPEPFDDDVESRDLHEGDEEGAWHRITSGLGGRDVATVLRTLKIAKDETSTVFDYRGSTPPNGGKINLQACVHHIPVIHNAAGRSDLDVLRKVLLDQGLMVQFGTDAEGNVAVYTRANRLCFHAKGGNQITCGIEHMHFTVTEPWRRKQFRAAAWIAQFLEREFGIPLRMAKVESNGSGRVQITRTGHTTHEQISHKAGFNDRSDPGPKFDFEQVFAAARFFKAHGHFVGA